MGELQIDRNHSLQTKWEAYQVKEGLAGHNFDSERWPDRSCKVLNGALEVESMERPRRAGMVPGEVDELWNKLEGEERGIRAQDGLEITHRPWSSSLNWGNCGGNDANLGRQDNGGRRNINDLKLDDVLPAVRRSAERAGLILEISNTHLRLRHSVRTKSTNGNVLGDGTFDES